MSEVTPGWLLKKPSPLSCYQCRLPYSGEHWVEAVVEDGVWAKISPTGNEGGILCINCMAERLNRLGLRDVPVKITAGPMTAARPVDDALANEVRDIAEDSNYSNEMVGIAVRNWFHRAAIAALSGGGK